MKQNFFDHKPALSIVVVVYNMGREAPRTLYSLSAAYQRDIAAEDYEVIIVDNGSSPPLDTSIIDELEGNFRIIRLYPAPGSPAHALNVGLAAARGDVIGLMIDGARMLTPGVLHFARAGAALYPRAVVATLGWYLGYDQQRWSSVAGYDQAREDSLLESINWREDGYRLFDIGAPDETTLDGWFSAVAESNAIFLTRENWNRLGGVEEKFDIPGGGLVNLDTIARALDLPDSRLVVLLGEGAFHQIHGGVSTSADHRSIDATVGVWRDQYHAIRGEHWTPRQRAERTYIGVLPKPALKHFAKAAISPIGAPPLGDRFDLGLWDHTPPGRPEDQTINELVDLAQMELRQRRFVGAGIISRLAREVAPDEPAVLAMLPIVGPWLRGAGTPDHYGPAHQVEFYCAKASALRVLGRTDEAIEAYHTALSINDDLPVAHMALTRLMMPGHYYLDWLGRLHEQLKPNLYLEIGVAQAHSMTLALPPTKAIGVDPFPNPKHPIATECHIFAETSDDFFAQERLETYYPGEAVDFAFIDGLHVYGQVLRDFANVEANCRPDSIIALHDTIPFDEPTQRPERVKHFYTGDTWKLIVCLRHYRPDLHITTIPAAPSGLTLVTNLDPTSRVLHDNLDEAIARFEHHDFHAFQADRHAILNIVPNDWSSMDGLLGSRPPKVDKGGTPLQAPPAASPAPALAVMDQASRALYVDLLCRALTNTIYRDPSTRPDDGPNHLPKSRRIGSDWPKYAHTMVGVLRLKNVAELTQRVIDENIPGDLIEAGVWRGGCCILMRGILAANGVTDRKVYAADSFEGLPAPNVEAYPADADYDLSQLGELAIPAKVVRGNFNRYGLLDDNVVFVEGFFSDTLPKLKAGPFALIRLDGDLYESTYVSLENLYPKLSPGGFVIIDDMNFIPPCRQAVLDYRAKMGITAPVHRVDWSASWWRKE